MKVFGQRTIMNGWDITICILCIDKLGFELKKDNMRFSQSPTQCLTSLSVKTNGIIVKPKYSYKINPP